VTPEDEVNAVEIVGELGALLQLTSNSENAASLGEAACSIKLVAGTRYLLYRNRRKLLRRRPERPNE
jgi:hypothetical protein